MHPIDEMHMYSNIAKDVFSMLSPKYNQHFKYCGDELKYPFELSNAAFVSIKKSMELSRQLIPAGTFKGSWIAMEPNNVKSVYRSAEWIDWLLYCVPTLILSQFQDRDVVKGFLNLIRGISLSLQFEITTNDLEEIDRLVHNYLINIKKLKFVTYIGVLKNGLNILINSLRIRKYLTVFTKSTCTSYAILHLLFVNVRFFVVPLLDLWKEKLVRNTRFFFVRKY